MACGSCGNRRNIRRAKYEYTAPDGTKRIYSSKTEVVMKVRTKGGSYKQVS